MSNGNMEKDQQGKRVSGFVVVAVYVYKDKKWDWRLYTTFITHIK
jgi:hypothetical protein